MTIEMGDAGALARDVATIPAGVHAAPSLAAACLASLAANELARRQFATPFTVEEVQLTCAVGTPCDRLAARAHVQWAHVHTVVELACTRGVIDVLTLPAQLAELQAVLAVKPVHVVVELADGAARIARAWRGWIVDPGRKDLPHIHHVPNVGTSELEFDARATPNPALWRALRLDPSTLVHENSRGRFSFEVALDRDGKIIAGGDR